MLHVRTIAFFRCKFELSRLTWSDGSWKPFYLDIRVSSLMHLHNISRNTTRIIVRIIVRIIISTKQPSHRGVHTQRHSHYGVQLCSSFEIDMLMEIFRKRFEKNRLEKNTYVVTRFPDPPRYTTVKSSERHLRRNRELIGITIHFHLRHKQ